MGVSTQPQTLSSRSPGITLPATLFGMVMIGLLVTGMFTLTNVEVLASRNRQDAVSAVHLAEAGASHALSVLRDELNDTSFNRLLAGFNNAGPDTDDGILDNFPGLGDTIDIPVAGRSITGGTYFVQVVDDPADTDGNARTDMNSRVVVRCTGVTTTGARAVIELVITDPVALPAVAFGGALAISGNPILSGACGNVHANGNLSITGTTKVDASATSSGTATGNVLNAANNSIPSTSGAPPLTIPLMSPIAACATADYTLQANGWVLRHSDASLHNATGSGQFGWKLGSSSPVQWVSDLDAMTPGTFCVLGNAFLGHNPGSAGSPTSMSIFATGSMQISGNPFLRPEDASGVTLMAGGDLKISGTLTTYAQTSSPFLPGLIYGGSQCEISGNPVIVGQFLCQGTAALPVGAMDLITQNQISGNPSISYGCNGTNPNLKRRIFSWYQRLNM